MSNYFQYTVDQVRGVATETSFKEVDHNNESCVISFRSDGDATRINVYYTTGTIGTCLNHPRKGKTQLFRRNVTIELLEQIFMDPRVHTGTGYYRKNRSQFWKSFDPNDGREIFVVDSARRWQYVASVTGLCRKQSEIDSIAGLCTEWDSLYWDPGQEPFLSHTRFSCGSRAFFENMILLNATELLGRPIKGLKRDEIEEFRSGQISPYDMKEINAGRYCCNLSEFLQAHVADAAKIMVQLKSFRKDVQIELMRWFFGRDNCTYELCDDNIKVISTRYSDNVDWAHCEYAALSYTKRSNLCPAHGVCFE
jgi:hypothetical protein